MALRSWLAQLPVQGLLQPVKTGWAAGSSLQLCHAQLLLPLCAHGISTASCSSSSGSTNTSGSSSTGSRTKFTASGASPNATTEAHLQDSSSWPSLHVSPRLSSVLGLHAGALWQRHKPKVYAVGGVVAVWLVWRTSCWLASPFMTVTHTSTSLGLLALSMGMVGAGAQYLRFYWGLNPAAVYRQALLRLNTSPAVLEVMGAPLVGSDVRAYIVTGGSLYLSRSEGQLKPKISSRRLQMIFPLRGSEREGLVSLEVKKQQGQHIFKLLAVDIQPGLAGTPIGSVPGARLYLQGDKDVYERDSTLDQLRGPFLKALHGQSAADLEDEREDVAMQASKGPRLTMLERVQQLVDRLTASSSSSSGKKSSSAPAAAAGSTSATVATRANQAGSQEATSH